MLLPRFPRRLGGRFRRAHEATCLRGAGPPVTLVNVVSHVWIVASSRDWFAGGHLLYPHDLVTWARSMITPAPSKPVAIATRTRAQRNARNFRPSHTLLASYASSISSRTVSFTS